MARALQPSVVTMPRVDAPYPTILAFLVGRFPAIAPEIWLRRIVEGTVRDEQDRQITLESGYLPQQRLFYFREVEVEPVIPFSEQIIYRDDEILVACKPHFLPVTPGGKYVGECLLNRLRERTGIADLVPLHRIDRETAGLVLFSVNRKTRGAYGTLFMAGHIEKCYEAVALCHQVPERNRWEIENRIGRGEPWFLMKTEAGVSNARSTILLREIRNDRGVFHLFPHTGKTHQLRLHMGELGFGILNDRYYPLLQPEQEDDFTAPLQLLAKSVHFTDPLTGHQRDFVSGRSLCMDFLSEKTSPATPAT